MPVPSSNFEDLLSRADHLLHSIGDQGGQESQRSTLAGGQKNIFQVFEQGERLWRKTVTDFSATGADVKTEDAAKPGTSLLWGPETTASQSSLMFPEKLRAAVEKLPIVSPISEKLVESADRTVQFRPQTDVPADDSELEQFLRQERESILMNLIDETLKTNSKRVQEQAVKSLKEHWDAEKRKLAPTVPRLNLTDMLKTSTYFSPAGLPKSNLSDLESRFAQAVSEYFERSTAGGIPVKLIDLFKKIIDSMKNEKFNDLWLQVKYMLDIPLFPTKSIDEQRRSTKFKISSTQQALKYLEKQFLRHMQMIVYGNLEQGQLGGVPGILNLVKAYLNIKLPPNGFQDCEDGYLHNQPVWAVIYYCLRVGDLPAACTACSNHESSTVAEFGQFIRELQKSTAYRLSLDSETKFLILWRTVGRISQDPFKKACFCVLAQCDFVADHGEVADKFEDWLWIKLKQVLITETVLHDDEQQVVKVGGHVTSSSSRSSRHVGSSSSNSSNRLLTLDRLRCQIVLEYGERHFSSGDSPLLYWSALWLTGQSEAAVDFLYRQSSSNFRCHALHIALVTYESDLLLTPDDSQAKLLSTISNDSSSSIDYRLNLSRMISLYVSQVLTTNLKDALNYLYFLRNFKSPDNENLFFVSIKDLLLETKEYELLLGRLNVNGTRTPGLIASSHFNVNLDELISFVAKDAEKRGLIEAAVSMYDLAEDHTKVLQMLSECLCQTASQIPTPGSKRERYTTLAVSIATRYRDIGHKADETTAVTFFHLLDIVTFFNLFHENQYSNALEVIRRIKLIPLTTEEVDEFVKQFYAISDEVRRTLPDVLLALMVILSHEYRAVKGERNFVTSATIEESVKDIRRMARSVVQYAAMVPYRMPGDTAARLVQMETFMH